MLTTQWTTLCIALAQALLLRHRLPVAFWPAAAVMLAGAAMVIAPSVGQVRAPGWLFSSCAGQHRPSRPCTVCEADPSLVQFVPLVERQRCVPAPVLCYTCFLVWPLS